MKYFVDQNGAYLGGWDEGRPSGGVEVPSAPDDARQVWLGAAWGSILLTRQQVEAQRLVAYANPVTGSDRYFSEAVRIEVMGGTADEVEVARAAGAVRYAEIQAEYPWP